MSCFYWELSTIMKMSAKIRNVLSRIIESCTCLILIVCLIDNLITHMTISFCTTSLIAYMQSMLKIQTVGLFCIQRMHTFCFTKWGIYMLLYRNKTQLRSVVLICSKSSLYSELGSLWKTFSLINTLRIKY